ncbi:amino acid ABC transporter ATP-binding protein [Treponema endosymbiont of Eucomonympha sp.]|uniref:amino acid ABC transporter ATP-binding protein n=1 Tax=Treponema endosymbiont of Eucomonympha sp. TaxID=1580831 RepID=UPI000750BCB1|nr:amino acid ABC transporter ATP-binding protein [Treponema endosymbiont of Eucomonympha sp.]
MIRLRNVHKQFGGKRVLTGVDFSVHDGETVALIGPSGSGKTTLLRCVNFLERADEGDMELDGRQVSFRRATRREALAVRRKTAMVFQQYNLFKNLTAAENIELGLRVAQKKRRSEAAELARNALALVGLADRAGAYPSELSGGQQQRIGIARAVALSPRIILFDEPTSALDPELVGEVLCCIKELADKGQTMLIVSHEMSFVRHVANRVVFMDGGAVVEEGAPEDIFTRPQKERTAQFLKRVTDDWADKAPPVPCADEGRS